MVVRFAGGQDWGSRLGSDVASAGDLDADGTPDWLATDRNEIAGAVVVVSGRTGAQIRVVDGPPAPAPAIGWRVDVGPDADADGVRDFASSCFRPNGGLGMAGQGVIVFSGKTGERIRGFVLEDSLPPGEAGRAGPR
jgi:hypothetical protein